MKFTTRPASHSYRLGFRIVLACLLAGVVTAGGAGEARAQDLAGDKQALVALYNATNGRNWEKNDNWLSNKRVADWHGVTVSNERVTGLNLGDNRLRGTIPSELGDLSSLRELKLPGNQLAGTIPTELGDLSNLRELNLLGNQLTGNIPSELGNLSSLTQLDLAYNRLAGTIPLELGNLSSLTGLGLSANQLMGAIPPELSDLSGLRRLNLFDNQLTGNIPSELGNLSSLTYLALTQNQLTGAIPPALGNLSHLTQLHLADNRLSGAIPPALSNLSALMQLVLSDNLLTGTIPSELTRLRSLRYFYFNLNSGLCIQDDAAIRTWLAGVGNVLGADCSPSVTLTVEPTTMVEGTDTDVTVTATRMQATNAATVILTFGGSAREDMDYVFSGEQEITIPAYKATATTTLIFEPAADDLEEGNETILVEASIDDQVEGSATITLIDVDTGDPFPARYEAFVPVILSAAGHNKSFFTSELTLTNRGTATANLTYTYAAHRGGGSGVAGDRLGPGEQKIIPDAIDYLRTLDTPIPDTGDRIGTLRVALSDLSSSDAAITVRTTTRVPEGRAGLAYPAISAEAGFDEAVYLCGLRQNAKDRSNVAFQNMAEAGEGAVTLRTTVFSGAVDGAEPRVLDDVTLAPGGFHQYSGLLEKAGFSQGYARVERVSGTAPFYAYGVINDQANSDGSFVSPVREGSLAGTKGQTLPVIVETDVFTSELMVTNFSNAPKTVTFRFRAEAVQTPDKTAVMEWTFRPGQQVMVPNAVDMMRKIGTPGIGPSGQTFAGALFATVTEGDMSGVAIGARTVSAGGGGQYGVFYNAVPYGKAFVDSAWVDALQQNEQNRSNLALVNTGQVDVSPSVFHLEIYDGETRDLVNTVTGLRVAAGGWRQINSILARYAPETIQGYVRVTKISGNNPFLAYGVINDGGAPGQRSGDGAYLAARK